MDSLLSWLGDNALALLAIILSVFALFRFKQLRKSLSGGQKDINSIDAQSKEGENRALPFLEYYPTESRTHAIRDQKLVNFLSLHFRNTGEELFYDNVEFERYNKRVDVEILSDKELEILVDPRDSQRVARGESLKITFEREIGNPMEYSFRIFFEARNGQAYSQKVRGKKGGEPSVEEPVALNT